MEKLKEYINEIKDFPKEGIVFKDINPIYKDPKRWNELMLPLQKIISSTKPDYIAGIESRGFIMGSAIAYKLNAAFVPLRKPDKLPYKTFSAAYDLEYGTTEMHIHTDALDNFQNVIIIDDLLATGGTALAAAKLVEKFDKKNILGAGFFIDLPSLGGSALLREKNIVVHTLVEF